MKQRILLSVLCILSWCLPVFCQQLMMPTEEDLIKMNQEIEAFRSSMTQEQRDEFDKQVEELSKVMENMSEKELEEFIGAVFNPENVAPIAPPMPVAPTPAPAVTAVKPAEPLYKPSAVPAKTVEAAKNMLLGLISQIEAFMRKAALIPDLYGTLSPWVPAAMLADKKELTWQELKQETERLVSYLKVLLATDPATGHYYYLSSVIENDALYQNIIRLNDALTRNEPTIAVTAFGLGDLTKEARKATGTILGSFVQALYTQQMNEEIKKLFSAFEPQAKKVMEQEEAARKRAIEESKRTPMQAPMRPGGTSLDDYAAATGYTPGLSDAYGSAAYVPPVTSYTPTTDFSLPSTDTRTTPAQKMATPADRGETPVENKAKEDAAKKQKEEVAPDKKITDSAEKITEKIEGFIEDCIIAIKAKKLDITVMDSDKREAVEETAGKIARIISRIKTLESVIKDLSTAQKDVYMDRIKIMIKEEKDLFDTIISATDADKNNELRKQIEALFKKLELTHTRKAIKPREPKKEPAQTPAAQAPRVTPPAQAPARVAPQQRTVPAVIHPAAIPTAIEEPLFDIHPAALQPEVASESEGTD